MTTGRRDFSATALLVAFVRRVLGDHSLEDAQKATRLHRNTVGAWEADLRVPRRSKLLRFLAGYGIPPALAQPLLDLMSNLSALLATGRSQVAHSHPAASHHPPVDDLLAKLEQLLHQPFPVAPPTAPTISSLDLQLARLLEFDHSDRLAFVRTASEFHTFALGKHLCAASVAAAGDTARGAAERAHLALAVADVLDHKALRAHAWGHLGNAYRVAGRLGQADRAIVKGLHLWASAPDHAGLDPGQLLSFLASLRRDQRRLPEALDLLTQAEPLTSEPGRLLLKRATILEHAGSYASALLALDRAAAYFGPHDTRDQFLLLLNRGVVFCHLGRHSEALPLAEDAISLVGRIHNHLDLLRAAWLRARVAAGLGEIELAEDLLRTIKDEFQRLGYHYDLALVSLELAGVLLRRGLVHEVLPLTAGLVERFASLGVHAEAERALRLFDDAVRQQTASAELAGRVISFLYRARFNDQIRFAA